MSLRSQDIKVEVLFTQLGGFALVSNNGIRVIHLPTGLSVESISERSQHRNRQVALEKLTKLMEENAMLTDKQILEVGRKYHYSSLWSVDFARAIEAEVSAPLQAKIDELMLEFCPNEMTPEQLAEWGRNQRPVSEAEQAATDKAVAEVLQAQEPVAWLDTRNGGLHLADRVSDCSDVSKLQPLYAASPPPAKQEAQEPIANIPDHIALLTEARDFGQFASDVIWTQAKPIVEAMSKLLDEVYAQYYTAPQPPAPKATPASKDKQTIDSIWGLYDAERMANKLLLAKVAEQSELIKRCKKALKYHTEMTRPILLTDLVIEEIEAIEAQEKTTQENQYYEP